jgi:membrane protein required for colicin V production
MFENLNFVDYAFIAFGFIFVLTAFLRGFVKEIFALFNWALALVLSYLLTPYVSKFCQSFSGNKLLIDISVRFVIFVIVFFTVAISTSGLCKSLKEKIPKAFDRSLGVLYGLGKTLLIFGFIYSLIANVYGVLLGGDDDKNAKKLPSWLVEAKTHNILKISGEAMNPLVKTVFDEVTKNFDKVVPQQKDLDKKIDEVVSEKTEDSSKSEAVDPKDLDSGYSKKEIEKMNRLIEIIQ